MKLSWPAAVCFSVFLFRKEIWKLLPLLHIKHKDTELSFRFKNLEEAVTNIPEPVDSIAPKQTPEEKDKFEQLARLSPRSAILETRLDLENALVSLAKSREINVPQARSMGTITRILRQREIIPPPTSAILDDLRAIGNRAAHDNDSAFTFDEAMQYRVTADLAMRLLANALM